MNPILATPTLTPAKPSRVPDLRAAAAEYDDPADLEKKAAELVPEQTETFPAGAANEQPS